MQMKFMSLRAKQPNRKIIPCHAQLDLASRCNIACWIAASGKALLAMTNKKEPPD